MVPVPPNSTTYQEVTQYFAGKQRPLSWWSRPPARRTHAGRLGWRMLTWPIQGDTTVCLRYLQSWLHMQTKFATSSRDSQPSLCDQLSDAAASVTPEARTSQTAEHFMTFKLHCPPGWYLTRSYGNAAEIHAQGVAQDRSTQVQCKPRPRCCALINTAIAGWALQLMMSNQAVLENGCASGSMALVFRRVARPSRCIRVD